MYDYNNKNKSKEDRVHKWYSVNIKNTSTSPYKREGLLYSIWIRLKPFLPFTSTKGCCK